MEPKPSLWVTNRVSVGWVPLFGGKSGLKLNRIKPRGERAQMSYCKDFGKDKVIFATKEDHEKPSNVTLGELEEGPKGLVQPNGEINWGCPCLGGMASGPCGFQFREAFSCFHYSKEELKGSECISKFQAMSQCMSEYPALYPKEPDMNLEDQDLEEPMPEFGGEVEKTVENVSAKEAQDKKPATHLIDRLRDEPQELKHDTTDINQKRNN